MLSRQCWSYTLASTNWASAMCLSMSSKSDSITSPQPHNWSRDCVSSSGIICCISLSSVHMLSMGSACVRGVKVWNKLSMLVYSGSHSGDLLVPTSSWVRNRLARLPGNTTVTSCRLLPNRAVRSRATALRNVFMCVLYLSVFIRGELCRSGRCTRTRASLRPSCRDTSRLRVSCSRVPGLRNPSSSCRTYSQPP